MKRACGSPIATAAEAWQHLTLGVLLLAGCGTASTKATEPAATASSSASEAETSSAHGSSKEDDARADACAKAALAVAPDAPPKVAMQAIIKGCLGVYREQGCKDALVRAIDDATDPSQRIRIMSDGCRDAYCPKLPAPAPSFCAAPKDADLATRQKEYPELTQAIIELEVGPTNAKRINDAFTEAEERRASQH